MEKRLNLTDKPDSVTIKETSKGDVYFDVKCYGDAETDQDELIERARSTYAKLVKEVRG